MASASATNTFTFPMTKYLRELEASFESGKLAHVALDARFPWGAVMLYSGASLALVAFGQWEPAALNAVPLAILIMAIHVAFDLLRHRRARTLRKRLLRPYEEARRFCQDFTDISITVNDLHVRADFTAADGRVVTREVGPQTLTGLDIGMGKYVELTSDAGVLYLPKTLFRQTDFHRISKPFFDVYAKVAGPRRASGDELERLREQIPILFQLINR